MALERLLVLLLVISVLGSAWCHHHHHALHTENLRTKEHTEHPRKFGHRDEDANGVLRSGITESTKKRVNIDFPKGNVPFSAKRLDKMLEKAILQIITGDLNTADMLLLKSLNYSVEEVQAFRERELSRRKVEELAREESKRSRTKSLYESTTEKRKKHRERNSMDSDFSTSSSSSYDRKLKKKDRNERPQNGKELDYEAYNRQAVLDYENLASKFETQQSRSEFGSLDYEEGPAQGLPREKEFRKNLHREFDKAIEPHVVFKIRYDDSEFDSNSGSDENGKARSSTTGASKQQHNHHVPSGLGHASPKNAGSFHAPVFATSSSSAPVALHTPLPVVYQLGNSNGQIKSNQPRNHVHPGTSEPPTTASPSTQAASVPQTAIDRESVNHLESRSTDEEPEHERTSGKKVSEYEGLEWVEDDVYRVIPAFADSLGYESNEENETSDYEERGNYSRQNWDGNGNGNGNAYPEGENDTLEYQNDATDSIRLVMASANSTGENHTLANLSTYQQLALAHRRDQGQKAIEDIKSRVLALTRRLNLTANANQVQRERLAMFSPTCQVPRNTDPDAWADPFSMNMHFQLNLTSGDHVVAAKLRIFKLPQDNLTSASAATFEEEEEEDEKKIRISIYYYTKSLKKHRSKKRLMDSVVTPLTAEGTHLALDVRQGLRFWRLNPRNPHGNGSNHGLVVQIEDQDGRPLKPALYIQQPSCGEQDSDQKACIKSLPALRKSNHHLPPASYERDLSPGMKKNTTV